MPVRLNFLFSKSYFYKVDLFYLYLLFFIIISQRRVFYHYDSFIGRNY